MNNPTTSAWTRLTAAARRAPATKDSGQMADDMMPAGFATRVVALAELNRDTGILGGALFERIATRALGLAAFCAFALALWSGLPVKVQPSASSEGALASETYLDPVGALLEAVEL